jgi:hypothetical protein
VESTDVDNPIYKSVDKAKYNVNATFTLGNEDQQIKLEHTGKSKLSSENNIVLVFDGEFYNGHIDCPNIDSVSGTFVVNGKTYTLEKKDDILQPSVVNYVQINCGGIVHSFELADVQRAAASALTNIFSQVNVPNADSKNGGKSGRKTYRKSGRKAARKLGRKSVGNKKRNRGTRKK